MANENDISSKEQLISFSRQKSLTDSENHDKFVESLKGKSRKITVEPLMMLYVIIMYLQATVMGQYIYYRVGKDHNLTHGEKLAHVCRPHENNTEDKNITDKIQSLNAEYTMFIQLSSSVFTILTAPFYCVFSDRYGRKGLFLLPGIGASIKSLFEILIQVYEWPIYVFAITEGFYGLFGGFNFATGLAYSYIADISTQKTRTKRMAIMGIMMAVGALCVSLSSGFWIQYCGYLIPYIVSGILSLLCLIYPIFCLKESPKMEDYKTNEITVMQQLKKLFTIYMNRNQSQTALLIIILIMFNFYYVAEMSGISLSYSYLMSYPICMTSIEISLYGFTNMLAINIGVGISVVILSKYFSDLVLVVLCLFSGIAFSIQMALAISKTGVIIAAASNLFSFSAFPFIRGYLSKRMGYQEQGALFGGLVLSETVSGAITKVVIIYFYGATFHYFHGMVYLFITCFSLVAVILTIIAIILDRKFVKYEKTVEIN